MNTDNKNIHAGVDMANGTSVLKIGYANGSLKKLSKGELIKEVEKLVEAYNQAAEDHSQAVDHRSRVHLEEVKRLRTSFAHQFQCTQEEVDGLKRVLSKRDLALDIHERYLRLEEARAQSSR